MRQLFVLVSVSASAWAQIVTVTQPGTLGLALIGSQSPEFQSALLAVISRPLAPQFAAYVSATSEDGFVQTGKSVLLTPGFIVSQEPPATTLDRLERGFAAISRLQRAKIVGISVDSAVFASGQFVGPGVLENFARIAAQFSAWRIVDTAVQPQLAKGTPAEQIEASLETLANQQAMATARSKKDWNAVMQAEEARRLLLLLQRRGADVLGSQIAERLRMPAIAVHR